MEYEGPLYYEKEHYRFLGDGADRMVTAEQVVELLAKNGFKIDADTLCVMARWPGEMPTPGWTAEGTPLFQALAIDHWLNLLFQAQDSLHRQRNPPDREIPF